MSNSVLSVILNIIDMFSDLAFNVYEKDTTWVTDRITEYLYGHRQDEDE